MEEKSGLKEKLVSVARVAKVVKGGRNFRFSVIVVVGDGNGRVGVGTGKAGEIPDAVKKAIEDASKNLVEVSIVGTTVPHELIGKHGAARVLVMPGSEGSGIIASAGPRAVLELAGYGDARAKIIGTNNPRNVVTATLDALSRMKTIEEVADKRNKSVDEII